MKKKASLPFELEVNWRYGEPISSSGATDYIESHVKQYRYYLIRRTGACVVGWLKIFVLIVSKKAQANNHPLLKTGLIQNFFIFFI